MYEWIEEKMLKFSDSFFQSEIRDNFFVDEIMKRYWACCMEIVHVIDEICQKHNLEYYADWGTLLGAVRHQGFIPWDDDMDICLKRPEYEKLMKILPEELPKEYILSNVFNNEKHKEMWAGVTNGRRMDISPEHMQLTYGCPFVAVIDIFPLDYVPRDIQEETTVKSLFVVIWNAVQLIKDGADENSIEEAVRLAEEYTQVKIDRQKNMRSQLWKIASQLVMSYTEEEGDYLVNWCEYVNKGIKFDKQWYAESKRVPFEETSIVIPTQATKILEVMYGDWKEQVRGGSGHDYPAFKKQIPLLARKLKEMEEKI